MSEIPYDEEGKELVEKTATECVEQVAAMNSKRVEMFVHPDPDEYKYLDMAYMGLIDTSFQDKFLARQGQFIIKHKSPLPKKEEDDGERT